MFDLAHNATAIGVGFGTAALGDECYSVVTMALQAGFRKFDTAEADWWYDQKRVGSALKDFFTSYEQECTEAKDEVCGSTCKREDLRISTKIPPWSLTSEDQIRSNAANSREELVGFCEDVTFYGQDGVMESVPFPLDVYYIHAPECWDGWHPRCTDHPPILDLRSAWKAMEAVVGKDHSAERIGLSNVHPDELEDIIQFVNERKERGETDPPPRIPNVVQAFADPIQPAERLREICAEHSIEFVSYSTLGTQHQYRHGNENPVLGSPIVKSIADKHGRSTAEVVLSWALQLDMSVIPRSRQWEHILELSRLLVDDPAFLDDFDMQQIDTMKYTL